MPAFLQLCIQSVRMRPPASLRQLQYVPRVEPKHLHKREHGGGKNKGKLPVDMNMFLLIFSNLHVVSPVTLYNSNSLRAMNSDSECTYGSMQLAEGPRIIQSTAMACTSALPVRTSCALAPSPPKFSTSPATSATKKSLLTTAGGLGRTPSSIARNYKQVPFPLFRFPQICIRPGLHIRPHHAQC